MTKTLLDGVNDLLKRVKVIAGDTGALTTLTDSAKQAYIDTAVQVWNESVEQLYVLSGLSRPNEMAEATITLVQSDRDYALASDLIELRWPLHDQTGGRYIWEWKLGYHNLTINQLQPAEWTGTPQWGAIRPTDGQLYLDRIPDATSAGYIYTYRYDKDVSLSAAADTFPFSDAVYRALIPVAAELWERSRNRSADAGLSRVNFSRAAQLLTKAQPRDSWLSR